MPKKSKHNFYKGDIMQLFSADLPSADATIFKKNFAPENMKKLPSKLAHNPPNFPQKCFPARLLYNDFEPDACQQAFYYTQYQFL